MTDRSIETIQVRLDARYRVLKEQFDRFVGSLYGIKYDILRSKDVESLQRAFDECKETAREFNDAHNAYLDTWSDAARQIELHINNIRATKEAR